MGTNFDTDREVVRLRPRSRAGVYGVSPGQCHVSVFPESGYHDRAVGAVAIYRSIRLRQIAHSVATNAKGKQMAITQG